MTVDSNKNDESMQELYFKQLKIKLTRYNTTIITKNRGMVGFDKA